MNTAVIQPEPTAEKLSARVETGIDQLTRAIERGDSDGGLPEITAQIGDVVEEAGHLLETVDLESLPDAIDFEELPKLVDAEQLPTAISDHDLDAALDLRTIRHAIRLRELWNSVDLVEFAKAKEQLECELVDVVGKNAIHGSGNSKAKTEVRQFVEEIRPEGTNAAIQQQAQKGARKARRGVLKAHAEIEDLYEANQRTLGYVGRRTVSRNPTAVSLIPRGPVSDSASTRFSSVPTNVRGAKIDSLPRIYGRRWRTVGRDRSR